METFGAKSAQQVVEKVFTGIYFSFMIVRHPLDRVVSAFRDCILNPRRWTATYYIPRIFAAAKVIKILAIKVYKGEVGQSLKSSLFNAAKTPPCMRLRHLPTPSNLCYI